METAASNLHPQLHLPSHQAVLRYTACNKRLLPRMAPPLQQLASSSPSTAATVSPVKAKRKSSAGSSASADVSSLAATSSLAVSVDN